MLGASLPIIFPIRRDISNIVSKRFPVVVFLIPSPGLASCASDEIVIQPVVSPCIWNDGPPS